MDKLDPPELVPEFNPPDEVSAGIVTTPQQSPSSPIPPQQEERTLAYVRQIQSPTAKSNKPVTFNEGTRSALPTRTPTQPMLGVQIDKSKLAQAVEVTQFSFIQSFPML